MLHGTSSQIAPTRTPLGFNHPDEIKMHVALRSHDLKLAKEYALALPLAREHVIRQLMAALRRENVLNFRTGSTIVNRPSENLDRQSKHDNAGKTWAIWQFSGDQTIEFPIITQHCDDQIEIGLPLFHTTPKESWLITHPVELLSILSTVDTSLRWTELSDELANAVANLGLALVRNGKLNSELIQLANQHKTTDTIALAHLLRQNHQQFDPMLLLERLCVTGHNLHPCARTRLGMDPVDVLQHDVESPTTGLRFIAIQKDYAVSTSDSRGEDIGSLLLNNYPHLQKAVTATGLDLDSYVIAPIHPWQLKKITRTHSQYFAYGQIQVIPDAELAAQPTITLRTLLTEPTSSGRRFFIKTALDIQVTSTRRTISVQTTANGPRFSRLIQEITAAEPALATMIPLAELAGISFCDPAQGPSRDIAALIREDVDQFLATDEIAIPGCGLYAQSPLTRQPICTELIDHFSVHNGYTDLALAAKDFLAGYSRLLLRPVIRLMTKYGIGLESHLQNSIITFVNGVPNRIVFRDWGGMRIYLPRLSQRNYEFQPYPGSVTVTDDLSIMQAKVLYTTLHNHLGGLVSTLVNAYQISEIQLWQAIRQAMQDAFDELADEADETRDSVLLTNVAADRAAAFASSLPHKALLTMRLSPEAGDHYVPLANPLRVSA